MRSPMPTLDAMLSGFHAVQWLLSLDNASGFWVVRATKRARLISAFICPLGHFEWTRMGQGLKNAPMIYQRMITNALCGFVDLPPGMNEVDEDVEPRDMFQIGHVRDASSMPAPANRPSFVDDISDGADSWTGVVDLTDRILQRLTYFNISISALKSKFGKTVVDFLGHLISREGIHAKPRGLHQVLQMSSRSASMSYGATRQTRTHGSPLMGCNVISMDPPSGGLLQPPRTRWHPDAAGLLTLPAIGFYNGRSYTLHPSEVHKIFDPTTFDGSIKFSERVGGFGAFLWQLPEWTILWSGYGVVTDTTVNGAEYAGLLAVLSAAIRLHLTGVRVFGDSRLVIQQ
ncbi:hypothetical protein AeMF1_005849, partial [Aphanomyces euteiches]